MRCDDLSDLLPALVDGERADTASQVRQRALEHVGTCLRCQAEVAQYRRLLRALHRLRTEIVEPAPGLLAEILAGLEVGEREAVRSLLDGRKAAYLGGLAVATAGAGAAVAVWIYREHASSTMPTSRAS